MLLLGVVRMMALLRVLDQAYEAYRTYSQGIEAKLKPDERRKVKIMRRSWEGKLSVWRRTPGNQRWLIRLYSRPRLSEFANQGVWNTIM
jgi:hypothetical protein